MLKNTKRIAIIGTAGRDEFSEQMTKSLYQHMIDESEVIVTKKLNLDWPNITLVSGGAAWSGMCAYINLFFV